MITGSSRNRFASRTAVAAGLVVFVALACEENITAPGACPDFCPVTVLELKDTVLTGAVQRDSAFVGYADAVSGLRLMIAGTDAEVESRGVIRFLALPDSIQFESSTRPIVSIDSFMVRLDLRRRDLSVSNLEVLLYRIPGTVDSTVTFDDLTPYFADSTLIGSVAVPDSVTLDSIYVPVIADAFPNLEAESYLAAIGISVRAETPTFATLASRESGLVATLTRYAQVDSADGTIVDHSDVRGAAFDTFVHEAVPVPPGDVLIVGGNPTARSLLRLTVPALILDSSEVVGAKLKLIPVGPVVGAPGDSIRVQVDALSADFGPKSPLVTTTTVQFDDSTVTLQGTVIAVGHTDTVSVDITAALRSWQADSTRPHSVMVRLAPTVEGATYGTMFFGSSRTAGFTPLVIVTYVPPFRFEGN